MDTVTSSASVITDDLSACPFCSGVGAVINWDQPNFQKWFVRCTCCAAEGPWGKTHATAIALWNKRSAAAATVHRDDLLDFVEYACMRFDHGQDAAIKRGEELLVKYGRMTAAS